MSNAKDLIPKLVEVTFNLASYFFDKDRPYCYGVKVELVDGKMVGKCSPEELKAFEDGGRV